ncbi:hypothetical protein BGZ63DRAFT_257962 [Mariannaea sp. PMI_226]|nr:hypothetical protein BGZ63DRAFT_257962 [Mariannaea sp. PMI_226]
MQVRSWALAAALAFAVNVAAEETQPRIYFPRQIKREVMNGNATVTLPHTVPSSTSSTSKTTYANNKLIVNKSGSQSNSQGTTTSANTLGSTGSAPSVVIQPTTTDAETTVVTLTVIPVSATDDPTTKTKTGTGILVGPGGIIGTTTTSEEATTETSAVEHTSATEQTSAVHETTSAVKETTSAVHETTMPSRKPPALLTTPVPSIQLLQLVL